MKTSTVKPAAPKWLLLDAEGRSIGTVAAKAAALLRGKHVVTYSPHQLHGDHVVVVNAGKLAVRRKKRVNKIYRKHTGYLGHLRSTTLEKMLAEQPTVVVEMAVKGMLPKNRLRPQMLKRLHVFAESAHTHEAQKPQPVPLS